MSIVTRQQWKDIEAFSMGLVNTANSVWTMHILICDTQKVKLLSTASTHVYGVVSCLSQMGHNVVLINSDFPKSEAEIIANPYSGLWMRIKNALLHSRILRLVGGEIAILWLFLRAVYVFISALIVLVRQKKRVDVIYRRHTLFNSEYILARMFRIPLIKEVNGLVTDDIEMMGWGNKISLRIMGIIEKYNMRKADKIIVITQGLKETLCKDYGIPSDKIAVIPNGTNIDLFRPMDTQVARDRLNLDKKYSYICFVGAFNMWSGIENIAKAAPMVLYECPNTRFLFIGDGVRRQELLSFAKQIDIVDKIIFTGMVPYQEVPLYINASDICVCPGGENFRNNRVGGGSPLKLPEYMSCAKPVIVGSLVELSEEIMHSGSGIIVDIGSAEDLAKACIFLLKNDEARKEMGEKGRKVAIEKYSWIRSAEKIVEVCQSVITQRKARNDNNKNR